MQLVRIGNCSCDQAPPVAILLANRLQPKHRQGFRRAPPPRKQSRKALQRYSWFQDWVGWSLVFFSRLVEIGGGPLETYILCYCCPLFRSAQQPPLRLPRSIRERGVTPTSITHPPSFSPSSVLPRPPPRAPRAHAFPL